MNIDCLKNLIDAFSNLVINLLESMEVILFDAFETPHIALYLYVVSGVACSLNELLLGILLMTTPFIILETPFNYPPSPNKPPPKIHFCK